MKRIIIDTDAGIDDGQAIVMALNSDDLVEVVAITTCHGNVDVDQVTRNVQRILKVTGRYEIPVYRGTTCSLIGGRISSPSRHGSDGFGDVPDPSPSEVEIQSENAVQALIRIVNENKGQLTLVCLAPLTNIALAIRLDPDFGKKLKDCFIMGGTYKGLGSTMVCADFNFYADPESARIVLKELNCSRITLITFDLCIEYAFTWPSAFETAVDMCNKRVVVPKLDGKPLDAWLLTEIDHWNFEKEKIVLLTENSFLIVKYDFIKLNIDESRRISLLSINKIQVGDLTYPQRSLMQSRDCGGVRIHFGDESAMSLRHRWNPWSRVIPYCTFIHHPLIYNKNESNTLIYNIDQMTETVKFGVEMALKRDGHEKELAVHEGPILIQSYAGLSSAVFNQSRIGFCKERGPVSF